VQTGEIAVGSKPNREKARWGNFCGGLAVLFLAPTLTFAQGCALCYTQASGSGSRMIAALRSGILMLAIPPMLICLGITWMAYKKRNQFNDDDSPETTENSPE
jgi:hypothetical protein